MRGRPHATGVMNRPDPFFGASGPHTNSYLESLHRQWGSPETHLPRRDDETFERAMHFRNQEKAKYKMIEEDNDRLKNDVQREAEKLQQLTAEHERIKQLFEQLSKPKTPDVEPRSHVPTASTRSVRAGSADSGNEVARDPPKSTTRRRAARSGTANKRSDEAAAQKAAPEDAGEREVQPADVHNPRGSSDEHAAEGPESRGGAESAGGSELRTVVQAESGEAIPDDEE